MRYDLSACCTTDNISTAILLSHPAIFPSAALQGGVDFDPVSEKQCISSSSDKTACSFVSTPHQRQLRLTAANGLP